MDSIPFFSVNFSNFLNNSDRDIEINEMGQQEVDPYVRRKKGGKKWGRREKRRNTIS